MKQLGYYAKDANGNLFKFQWSTNNEFSIIINGTETVTDPKDFEILEIGFFTAESKQKLSTNGYSIYLMIELAKCYGLLEKETEYDILWEEGKSLYAQFEQSKFDDPKKGEYDCIEEFLKSKK
jgi:hypothetical protein